MEEGGFSVVQDAFQGTLSELAYALRNGDVASADIDLIELVRSFLAFFERVAARDLASAAQALPQVAQIVELKIRLLLPHPPATAEEEGPLVEAEEVLRVVLELENFEGAVDFPPAAPRPPPAAASRPDRAPGLRPARAPDADLGGAPRRPRLPLSGGCLF